MSALSDELLLALAGLEGNTRFKMFLDWVRGQCNDLDNSLDAAKSMSDGEIRDALGRRAAFREILDVAKNPSEVLEEQRQAEYQSDAQAAEF